MNLDATTLSYIIDGLILLLMFWVKAWKTEVDKRLEETSKQLVEVQLNYTKKDELLDLKREIISRFDRLEDRLTHPPK